MRIITSKNGDLISCFDKINENYIDNTSLKQTLNTNHEPANRGKAKGQIPLEYIFGFCKTFKKITKNLGFHPTFKTADLQDSIYTTLEDAITITIKFLYSYVPVFIPSPETKNKFIESIKTNYSISYDSWNTHRKIVNEGIEFKVGIGSAQNINSSYLPNISSSNIS